MHYLINQYEIKNCIKLFFIKQCTCISCSIYFWGQWVVGLMCTMRFVLVTFGENKKWYRVESKFFSYLWKFQDNTCMQYFAFSESDRTLSVTPCSKFKEHQHPGLKLKKMIHWEKYLLTSLPPILYLGAWSRWQDVCLLLSYIIVYGAECYLCKRKVRVEKTGSR